MARDDGAQMSAHLLLGSIGFSIPDRFVHRSLLGELLSAVGGLGLQRRTPLDHRLRLRHDKAGEGLDGEPRHR